MKSLSCTLIAFLLVASNLVKAQTPQPQVLNATQVSKLDLNGKWSGTRNQYSWDKKSFVESFQYEFDLQQNGNIVTGTSTIMNSSGDFADMKLEGIIIGNKLHFREYQIQDAIRPARRLWCFKSGELYFTKDGDNVQLTGATPSYMEVYNYPCSGGVTNVKKVDNSMNLAVLNETTPTNMEASTGDNMTINTYPNPFAETAKISYVLPNSSSVKLEVYDISGKLVSKLFDGDQNAGNYNYGFDATGFNSFSGVYIVKMTINNTVYSRQMVQMR